MISFRYHLVSIAAMFLALALGIVIGTTALSGPITKDLRTQLNGARKDRDALAVQTKQLQGQLDDAHAFADTYAAQLVSGALPGKSVLVVALPNTTSAMQTGVTREITAAGGKVSGVVTLTKNYLDPRLGDGIKNLATGPAHPTSLTLPVTSDAGQLGGALLSWVLLGKGQKTDLTQVLGGLAALHLVSLSGTTVTASNLVVVLGAGTLVAKQYGSSAQLALVSWLAHYGGHVVVAGDPASAAGGGIIAAARTDSEVRGAVSTVDDADDSFGQVSTALALGAADKGELGNYGTSAGAEALFPTPGK